MTNVTNPDNTQSVSTELDNLFNSPLAIERGEDGVFYLAHGDAFKQSIKDFTNFVETVIFEDEDRKTPATARAQVVKVSNALKAQIKEAEEATFGPARAQVTELLEGLDDLRIVLKRRVDYTDRLYKETKTNKLANEFRSLMEHREDLADSLEFRMILDPSWLNRSISDTAAISRLHERVKSVDALVPHTDLTTAIDLLTGNSWNAVSALTQLNAMREEEERRRVEEEARLAEQARLAEEARAAREEVESSEDQVAVEESALEAPEEQEQEKKAMSYFIVGVPQDQVKTFKRLAFAHDWTVQGA